jgi:hypothetical protein
MVCFARAVSGQAAAAPPSCVMKSRRLNRWRCIWVRYQPDDLQDIELAAISQRVCEPSHNCPMPLRVGSWTELDAIGASDEVEREADEYTRRHDPIAAAVPAVWWRRHQQQQ